MKFRLPEILLGCLLTIAVFAMGMLSSSQHHLQQTGGHSDTYEFYGVKPGEFLLFLATVGLWYATARLVRDAKENARRQLRAYIGVEPGGVVRLQGEDSLIGHYTIRNVGGIPAKNIAMYSLTSYFHDG